MDVSRPPFAAAPPFSTQDARSQDALSSGVSQPPRITDVNLVEEMRFSSALDGVTVDVSMVEEIYHICCHQEEG
jgi:hypothetical protein